MNLPGNNVLNALRFSYRKKRLDSKTSMLSSYRYSHLKPEKISSGKFSLFHRPRMAWTALQIIAISAVALWTIRNYVHVFKDL